MDLDKNFSRRMIMTAWNPEQLNEMGYHHVIYYTF